MKCLKIIGLLAGLALLHGCAAVPESHKLTYEPQLDVTPVEGASQVAVNVVVEDVREDQRRISHKRHSWGFPMASIHSEEPVEEAVKAAIEQELLARGFGLDGDASVIIQGDITELYSNLHLIDTFFTGKAVGKSTIQLEVMSEADEVLFSREISVAPEHKGLMYQSASNLARPVELAIEETLDELFDDPLFMDALLSDSHVSGIR
ncbi:YajG family lipoprotein [Vreelandella titanicae]|uniref:YajG family lipoprotein n=1 Tax=Vreelandella titanicae TaxID=664683 RepID=UPI003CFC3F9F|tara:strand:- start:1231 stop:1848 length:618 start_codon:yes stop_codon:yes gene_type:complete